MFTASGGPGDSIAATRTRTLWRVVTATEALRVAVRLQCLIFLCIALKPFLPAPLAGAELPAPSGDERLTRLAMLKCSLRSLVGRHQCRTSRLLAGNRWPQARRPHVGRKRPQDRCASYVIAVYRVVVDSCPREITLEAVRCVVPGLECPAA